ncbi:Uncharacterised protein [uncultured archaeon]|nr:Uncharacterised protein [uncultured archaeon]
MKPAIVALLLAVFLLQGVDAALVVKEDFVGDGQFLTFTDAKGATDRALCLNGSLAYGRSLSISGENSSLFSGFNLEGTGSYRVATPDHYLSVYNGNGINATSTISIGKDSSSIFRIAGRGDVRERVLASGPKGRPLEITSMYSSGRFRVNSSILREDAGIGSS